jgi:hypothetical protein
MSDLAFATPTNSSHISFLQTKFHVHLMLQARDLYGQPISNVLIRSLLRLLRPATIDLCQQVTTHGSLPHGAAQYIQSVLPATERFFNSETKQKYKQFLFNLGIYVPEDGKTDCNNVQGNNKKTTEPLGLAVAVPASRQKKQR